MDRQSARKLRVQRKKARFARCMFQTHIPYMYIFKMDLANLVNCPSLASRSLNLTT